MTNFEFTSDDGTLIYVYRWSTEKPTAVVQIAHGGCEHGGRYSRLAAALNEAGYEVYANDHRGHGRSALPNKLGVFAEEDGWNRAVNDLSNLNQIIAKANPDLPIVLLGHSMGSLMAQQYLAEYGNSIAALALSGSTLAGGFAELLPAIAAEEAANGRDAPNQMMGELMGGGGYNSGIEAPSTGYDWLSRDAEEVQKYIDDPFCGFSLSNGAWLDMFGRNRIPVTTADLDAAPKEMPIYIFSGDRDPASNNTEALKPLLELYEAAGFENVCHRYYAGARHELLNETNRDEVTTDLIAWLSANIG